MENLSYQGTCICYQLKMTVIFSDNIYAYSSLD